MFTLPPGLLVLSSQANTISSLTCTEDKLSDDKPRKYSFQEVIFQTEASVRRLCLSDCLNHPSATDGRQRREERTTRSRDS